MRRLVSAPWGPAKRQACCVRDSRSGDVVSGDVVSGDSLSGDIVLRDGLSGDSAPASRHGAGRGSTQRGAAIPPLLLLAASWLALGCGPSFEAIQEGDLRFAHCDRLDLDPSISASHRLHCWREWRRVYTYGQTRDRVEYAQRRIAEVVSGDSDPPFELPSGSSRPADANHPAQPNPAHSPPPAVVPLAGTRSALARDAPEGEFGPGCRSRCEAARAACAPGCGTQAPSCKACESAFQTCLVDCKSPP